MNKEEFVKERTKIISEMLDNPDECGIYPTGKCFAQLDELFDRIIKEEERRVKESIETLQDKYDLFENKGVCLEPTDRIIMLAKVKILEELKKILGIE